MNGSPIDQLVKIKIEKLNKFGLGNVQKIFRAWLMSYRYSLHTSGEVSLIKINKNKVKGF